MSEGAVWPWRKTGPHRFVYTIDVTYKHECQMRPSTRDMGTQTRNFMNSQFNLDVKLIPLLIAKIKIILSATFYLVQSLFTLLNSYQE
jgi:hypothetical protein